MGFRARSFAAPGMRAEKSDFTRPQTALERSANSLFKGTGEADARQHPRRLPGRRARHGGLVAVARQAASRSRSSASRLPTRTTWCAALADSEIVCAMRERTPFPKSTVDRLPKLKLLITTGMRNASFDMEALKATGRHRLRHRRSRRRQRGHRRARLGPHPRRRAPHRRGPRVDAPGRLADPHRPSRSPARPSAVSASAGLAAPSPASVSPSA